MKPEELQIGDWVEMDFYSPQPCDDYPDEDWRPVQLKTQEEIDNCAKYVCPLTLTNHIMQKNGYRKAKMSAGSYRLTNDYRLNLVAKDVGQTCWVLRRLVSKKSGGVSQFKVTEIHYVHELQHILKKLDVEKEIIV